MKNAFLNIFSTLVEEEFKENPKILEFPDRLLNSKHFNKKMYIIYLKELYISSSYILFYYQFLYNCILKLWTPTKKVWRI